MGEAQRLKCEARGADRISGTESPQLDLRGAGPGQGLSSVVEDVTEALAQLFAMLSSDQHREWGPALQAKDAQIVHTVDVIGVKVGDENGVHASDSLAQKL